MTDIVYVEVSCQNEDSEVWRIYSVKKVAVRYRIVRYGRYSVCRR